MARVLIIQNDAIENLGLYEIILKELIDVDIIHAYAMDAKEEYPPSQNYTHYIVGPTPISANEAEQHCYLAKEIRYLKAVVESGRPLLGVCCGGQILARLLGAKVVRSPRKEVGGYTITLTEDGLEDAIFRGFPRTFPVFHWHTDMFKVPSGGRLLATGDPCPVQAYSWGNVRGVIFHLEINCNEARRWAKAYPSEPLAIGKTEEMVIDECLESEHEMGRLAQKLTENFLNMN